ncbi:helix-turn-helix domain-containing protein [Fodinicola acaciae]|uniref:helix-turn-helix domain-containing protein n=1 Tax=Fodinicola acaciae TaxID=2681555 RepID=UPI0013D30822|nr:helix-turn-helix domain-containing protein [Fodinicola acaciae]
MEEELYSVEQVANLLGLHVKTVRGYVRDGRLKAVRIGKQYRIARADLADFTGGATPAPIRESTVRQRRSEVSSVVQIDAIGTASANRISLSLTGAANTRTHDGTRLRIDAIYDEERASLKIILHGDLENVAELLKLINMILEDER